MSNTLIILNDSGGNRSNHNVSITWQAGYYYCQQWQRRIFSEYKNKQTHEHEHEHTKFGEKNTTRFLLFYFTAKKCVVMKLSIHVWLCVCVFIWINFSSLPACFIIMSDRREISSLSEKNDAMANGQVMMDEPELCVYSYLSATHVQNVWLGSRWYPTQVRIAVGWRFKLTVWLLVHELTKYGYFAHWKWAVQLKNTQLEFYFSRLNSISRPVIWFLFCHKGTCVRVCSRENVLMNMEWMNEWVSISRWMNEWMNLPGLVGINYGWLWFVRVCDIHQMGGLFTLDDDICLL